ncbi:MAG: flagellar hook protein FlgE [Thermincola sp.]|jgi:flagellar hook protein FlgE|nr:flagellar hook protein FlgE [Thermincola sp.]MDT3701787.1 flagellar hook protein FlgE [Thermincola sp.]
MMRSMFAGVSGLRNHQTRMDVIGNNIANVNTVGYKRSKVIFQDMLSQNIRGASSPQGGRGGTNPQQVGLGVTVGSIDIVHTQGSSETTGKTTDMMVDGDGLFIVANGSNKYYTRGGNFDFDAAGSLINGNGLQVQGWNADATTGAIDTTQLISGIVVSKGVSISQPTSAVEFSGNLNANTVVYNAGPPTVGEVGLTANVFDSLGNSHTAYIYLQNNGDNTWTVSDTSGDAANPTNPAWMTINIGQDIAFNPDGTFLTDPQVTISGQPVNPTAQNFSTATPVPAGDLPAITLDFSGASQFAGATTVQMTYQDGAEAGTLTGFAVDKTGVITGQFSNGISKQLAQVAIANFSNPGGLSKAGGNVYSETNNSGAAQIGTAGTGGRGEITPGALEMSNVDLSQEFTDMIITQRGFQANSRIITTSDEMLQELVNLKR